MTTKKPQHQRSVETLGLSGDGMDSIADEKVLTEIQRLIAKHTKQQPYSRNTLLRIKELIEGYFV